MPRLRLQRLSLRLPDCDLHEVSLDVAAGEYLCLMGPTGAGKTVLLEIIAGMRQPDRGRIWLDGRDIGALPSWQRGIAFVPQDAMLFPHLSVAANIGYGLLERRLDTTRLHERVAKVAEAVGVSHLLDRQPSTLSGGEAQRVALARALALSAGLVLLDEPFAAVDERNRERLGARVQALLRAERATVLHVSHSLDEATAVADRVAVIASGQLLQVATPADLLRRPNCEFVATFTGARNVIPGNVANRDGQSHFIAAGLDLPLNSPAPTGPGRLVIRPEELRLGTARSAAAAAGLTGHIDAVNRAGAMLRLDIAAAGLRWVVLAAPREMDLMGLAARVGQEVALEFPAEAIHIMT